MPATLERGIAGTGRVVDKEATFEYICTKCHRSHCFYGKDIIEAVPVNEDEKEKQPSEEAETAEAEVREYVPTGHYLIGEEISHPSHEVPGLIVGKEPGIPNRIIVQFGKVITPLVEDIE